MTKKAPFIFLVGVPVAVLLIFIAAFLMRQEQADPKKMATPMPTPSPVATTPVAPPANKPSQPAPAPARVPATQPGKVMPAPTPEPKNGPLFGTSWRWQKTTLKTGVFTPKYPERFILSFETSVRMRSTADCNSFSANYTAIDGLLRFEPISATTVYTCKDSQELSYTGYLADVTGYTVSGNTLTLKLKASTGSMTFTRVYPN